MLLPYCFFILLKHFFNSTGARKLQIKYLILGSGAGWIGAEVNFLPDFSIYFYPYLNILTGLYPIVIAYAIVCHKLMDIEVVIKKSIVYSILVAIITLTYFLVVFLLERFAQGVLGYQSLTVSIATAFGLGIFFVPLRQRIQGFIDRRMFKGSLNEVALQNEMLLKEVADKEKAESISALAAGVAHEVRNPVTSLMTFCRFVPEKKDDPEFIEKFVQMTGQELNRISQLTTELLEYAKPSKPKMEKVDIKKLIEDSIDLSVRKDEGVEVSTEYGDGIGDCLADRNQMKQVLLNLIKNAKEAIDENGRIMVKVFGKGERIIISIEDNGCGIEKENLEKLFDPFFTSGKKDGTGLGLAICKGIVENMGGRIGVKSTVGKGTIFSIELSD